MSGRVVLQQIRKLWQIHSITGAHPVTELTRIHYIGHGSFDIPVELDDLTRPSATDAANGTFVYRIEEVIPTNTGDLAYTDQPVYARLSVEDQTDGTIKVKSVEYTWDEVGNNSVLVDQWLPNGTGSGTAHSQTANFINREKTSLALDKVWDNYNYAVQDSNFVLQQSTDGEHWTAVSGADKSIEAGAKALTTCYEKNEDDQYVQTTDTLINPAKTYYFKDGENYTQVDEGEVLALSWADLPAYAANGTLIKYRAVEQMGNPEPTRTAKTSSRPLQLQSTIRPPRTTPNRLKTFTKAKQASI